jgi:hypothetical protein
MIPYLSSMLLWSMLVLLSMARPTHRGRSLFRPKTYRMSEWREKAGGSDLPLWLALLLTFGVLLGLIYRVKVYLKRRPPSGLLG